MIAFVDGGCRGNHQKDKPREAYGSYKIIGEHGEAIHAARLTLEGARTNNEAEYMSLIALLKDANLSEGSIVLTDSQLLVGQLEGGWHVNAARLKELHAEAKKLLHEKRVKLMQVPRTDIVVQLGH